MSALAADTARFLELTLTPRTEYVSEQERLKRRNEALENRHRVMVQAARRLPDTTTSAEVADLLQRLAAIGD